MNAGNGDYTLRLEPVFDAEYQVAAYRLGLGSRDTADARPSSALAPRARERLAEIEPQDLLGESRAIVTAPAEGAAVPPPWPAKRLIVAAPIPEDAAKGSARALELAGTDGWQGSWAAICDLDLPAPEATRCVRMAPAEVFAAASPAQLRTWHEHGGVTLALRVRSREQFDALREQGVDWFQGPFWKVPQIKPGRSVPANHVGALRLLGQLQHADATINDIERIIKADATLSYKLLKLLNSPFFHTPGQIETIRHGVSFFGLDRIRNWATVIVMNSFEYQPQEVIRLGAERGRAAELLARACGLADARSCYLAGLFSVLDALFDLELAKIIEPLGLGHDLNRALTEHAGPLGQTLRWTLALEGGPAKPAGDLVDYPDTDLLALQVEAIAFSRDLTRGLNHL